MALPCRGPSSSLAFFPRLWRVHLPASALRLVDRSEPRCILQASAFLSVFPLLSGVSLFLPPPWRLVIAASPQVHPPKLRVSLAVRGRPLGAGPRAALLHGSARGFARGSARGPALLRVPCSFSGFSGSAVAAQRLCGCSPADAPWPRHAKVARPWLECAVTVRTTSALRIAVPSAPSAYSRALARWAGMRVALPWGAPDSAQALAVGMQASPDTLGAGRPGPRRNPPVETLARSAFSASMRESRKHGESIIQALGEYLPTRDAWKTGAFHKHRASITLPGRPHGAGLPGVWRHSRPWICAILRGSVAAGEQPGGVADIPRTEGARWRSKHGSGRRAPLAPSMDSQAFASWVGLAPGGHAFPRAPRLVLGSSRAGAAQQAYATFQKVSRASQEHHLRHAFCTLYSSIVVLHCASRAQAIHTLCARTAQAWLVAPVMSQSITRAPRLH